MPAASNLSARNILRRHWLQVVMLFACALLAMLCIEQGRVIESQRTLIRSLFSDSVQLNALRVEQMRQNRR